MSKRKIIFIGAGGHSKSVYESLDDNIELVGYIDDKKEGTFYGKKIFGKKITEIHHYPDYLYFVTIGDNKSREHWFSVIQELGLKTINIIDKTAIISKTATIGNGNFIGKGVIVNADVTIGSNNILNTRCIVEHECKIGNHVHVSTNAVVNGDVVVNDGAFIGSCSVVIGQIEIGTYSITGAGSVVIKNVDKESVYVGVPARKIKSI